MSMKRWLFVVSLTAGVGCVHTTNVPLRPNYGAEIRVGQALTSVVPLTFYRGEFADKRPDPTKLASFQQGVHTYNLLEERPIGDAIFEGLKATLSASKQTWNDSTRGDIKVNVTFLSLNAVRNAGFVTVGANSTMQIKVDFLNPRTEDVIYTNVYSGSDERSGAFGFMSMVISSIDASILRCVQGVSDDAGLAKALSKPR